jgi:galactokinase/mevalonate kinase-like predicted kinase
MNENLFPFDCIIVTSPDAASAKSAEGPLSRILERRLKKQYPSQTIRIVSTYDPFGARCGSGGGTLAALEEYASPDETILVLHAGGDSSRCPTQMILGKAWTSLPCGHYPNPTIWLIDQIQQLYKQANFPKGTLLVAATDCLATFFENGSQDLEWNYQYTNESVVLGVAVPAVVTTAKNHGVYILSEDIAKSTSLGVEDPLGVWQKPTVEQLITTQDPVPASFTMPRSGKDKQAWIDTGIVVFLPKAVQTLYELSEGILARCTRKGLEAAYHQQQQQQQQESPPIQTLEEFAKDHALKIDLYTDILHNLSWPTQQEPKDPDSSLRQVLSQLPLQILVAPEGRFLHLGTTQELVDFVTSGAYPDPNSNANTIAALASHISLQPRYQCWTDPQPHNNNVALQSTFPPEGYTIEIGTSALVEYCDLASYESVTIGNDSMVSGWRNPTKDTAAFQIPSNVSVQLLALKEETNDGTERFAYMVLGMQDAIKTHRQECTIYGLSIPEFLSRTGVTLQQLGWNEDYEKNDNLWGANIHPKVPAGISFNSVFGWLAKLQNPDESSSLAKDATLLRWISSPRVSLKELHSLADAELEWKFRLDLEVQVSHLQRENFIPYVQSLLRQRCHDKPCDFQWIIEMKDRKQAAKELLNILLALEEVAREEMGQERYDVCGRAFMMASALLADFDDGSNDKKNTQVAEEVNHFCSAHIQKLRSSSTCSISREEKFRSLDKIIEYRKGHMEKALEDSIAAYSKIMERLSFCMNELSIAGGFHRAKIISRRESPVVTSKWVLAMAPARVDLAGSWSDTPPICYEFGGSVTGMAVLVDDHMPLSCRCRIVPGEKGVLLRAEVRDSFDGSLSSFLLVEITEISQLSDFRDPLSDCALVKSALVCLGMVTEKEIQSGSDLQPLINKFCSSTEDVRIEVVTASLLPHGSGMGTSSILGGCILAAVAKCVGIGELSYDYLLHAVLMLEQLLSSGGGWQDQANGIVAGLKTVRSNPSELPLVMSVEKLDVDPAILAKFEKRMILAFTGKTRLAKNILQDVLRRWARRTNEIVTTVKRLVDLSEETRAAILQGDLDALGRALHETSKLKVAMTGEDSGAIPQPVKTLVAELMKREVIKGASLCGAGGGGFMMMMASEGFDKKKVSDLVQEELLKHNEDLASFTWHDCRVCNHGLTTQIIEDKNLGLDAFKLSWLFIER